ncbi:stage II sporulation protein E [Eubacterium multiforme]|uniref:Stage II sporulation protein E n=1 Tax=Eubacterium multiforme TaxID=83339 RepID=A0ABT9UY97_9FIRM|nr:stage II sporulation protein E [Eubacterium multiforme]MDQ0151287.1 stage II sporulation protein E [Eubacterium multiforme]
MQYRLNENSVERMEEDILDNNRVEVKSEFAKLCLIFITILLLSRVTILIGEGDVSGISPFGLAFFISVIVGGDRNKIIVSGAGALIGYFTINATLKDGLMYLSGVLILLGYSLIADKLKKRVNEKHLLFIVFLSNVIYGLVISNYDLGVNITISGLNTILIVPVYYIINYGLKCVGEYNSNYFFNIEEIISISIIICLMASGVGGLTIGEISIRTIISLATVISIAYIGGASNGAAIGISMGVVIGITAGDMIGGIGLYGSVGLIVGLFKETGKIFSFLSSIMVYLIISLYSQGLHTEGIIEVLLGGILFLIIPKKILSMLETEMCNDAKVDMINDEHLKQVKGEFTKKIQGFESVLNQMEKSLNNISENNNLSYKNRSTALIENLADRVCSGCSECNKCWNREFNQTYTAFEVLLKGREEGRDNFPIELEKKCIKKTDLIRNSDSIINILNGNEITRRKLEEGRKLVTNHIRSISGNLNDMIVDFKRDVTWGLELEKTVRKELNRNSINYKDVFCFTDKGGRINIKIKMENCLDGSYCSKNVLPAINEIMRTPMTINEDGCRISPNNKECTILIQEMPKYKVTSYAGMRAKEGEQYTGDTYTFGRMDGGNYITLLSDGMGSGPEAGKESKITVDLVEKFVEEGFEIESALNTVNSIMNMKFEEDEKFATLDLNLIDLYSGKISFYKVGAAASFIKRGNKIKKISSNMPPFGLVDKMELESVEERVKGGDIIITLSDGVLDVDKNGVGDSLWLEDYLKNKGNNPKELAQDILEYSKEINNGTIKDDMTIVVSKVYSVY